MLDSELEKEQVAQLLEYGNVQEATPLSYKSETIEDEIRLVQSDLRDE